MPSYDTVVWLPNALVLTALLLIATWFVTKSRGLRAGVRMLGVSMLPLGLYFLGAWRLIWSLALQFSTFFSGFVFRPTAWVGAVMLACALALIIVPGRLVSRAQPRSGRRLRRGKRPGEQRGSQRRAGVDDELAEIEEILKRRGIE